MFNRFAAFLCICLALPLMACVPVRAEEAGHDVPPVSGAQIWDKPVNGDENAQAYRDFWKARIVEFAQAYDFQPQPVFCPSATVCNDALDKLRKGRFDVIAPNVFSRSDIEVVRKAAGVSPEKLCPKFRYGNTTLTAGIYGLGDVFATNNFAFYDLTSYPSYLRTKSAKRFVAYRAENFISTPPEMATEQTKMEQGSGSFSFVSLPQCHIVTRNADANDSAKTFAARGKINELLLLDGNMVFLNAYILGEDTKEGGGIRKISIDKDEKNIFLLTSRQPKSTGESP